MIPFTLGEVAAIVGGTLRRGDPGMLVTAPVEFDSRKATPGGLFLAFDGEFVDGHDYVVDALARGAVAAIVTHPVDGPSIEVADGRSALAALASAVARRLYAVIVAITGSSGKTSTKDLVAQLLSRLGPTIAPPGSFNNELGHPYTVCLATRETRFLVLEASARGIGHIRYLAGIAPPRIGVVLNVGSAHLGEFGSRAAIALAKGELVEALPVSGTAVLNADDPLVRAMRTRTAAKVVLVGESADADLRADDVRVDASGRAAFTLNGVPVQLQLLGTHQIGNAVAAAAVALEAGMALPDIADALGQARPVSRWRMEVTERADGVTIINDAYNANPESMRAALKTLALMAGGHRSRRTWAILGPMGELGEGAHAEHDALGRLAVRLDVARLVAVGEAARPIAHGAALEGSWDGESCWLPDVDAAIGLLRAELAPGDVVLVKASRAARLERIALALTDDGGTTTGEEAAT